MTPEMLHPCAHRIALTYPFTELLALWARVRRV